jgi:hypothetical protein
MKWTTALEPVIPVGIPPLFAFCLPLVTWPLIAIHRVNNME